MSILLCYSVISFYFFIFLFTSWKYFLAISAILNYEYRMPHKVVEVNPISEINQVVWI